MNLLFQYIKILYKSQLQYRTSFILTAIGQFFVPFFVFISILLYFQRFSNIGGFTLYEVAFCYGITHLSFSLSESFARGFDSFSSLIRNGDFDRLLVRPRNIVLQVLGSKFEFTRIGRLIQSILILIYSLIHIQIDWTPLKILTLIFMILSGTIIFSGIFILGATLCFWTIEGLEVINVFTDGGREMTQYPLSIYNQWLRRFFTFVIPFGTVNYLPLLYLTGRIEANLYTPFIPLFGMAFIIPALYIFNLGVRHYKSTGS